jgi:hypothetical protein
MARLPPDLEAELAEAMARALSRDLVRQMEEAVSPVLDLMSGTARALHDAMAVPADLLTAGPRLEQFTCHHCGQPYLEPETEIVCFLSGVCMCPTCRPRRVDRVTFRTAITLVQRPDGAAAIKALGAQEVEHAEPGTALGAQLVDPGD